MTARASGDILDAVTKRYRGTTITTWGCKTSKRPLPHDVLGLSAVWTDGNLNLVDADGETVLAGAQTPRPDTSALRTHVDRWTATISPLIATGDVVRDAGRALLHDAGIDPVRAHALAGVIGEAKWLVGPRLAAIEHAQGRLRSVRQLTDRIFWIDGQLTIIGHSLPSTLQNACIGQPLRDLVSHPVLNGFDLTVRDIDLICPTGSASVVSMVVKVD